MNPEGEQQAETLSRTKPPRSRRVTDSPAGRNPKPEIDPDVAKAICDNLELGMPLSFAAEAEGVSRSTVYRWRDEFEAFAGMVTRATAMGVKVLTTHALSGGKGSSAASWFLERRFREEYGNNREDNDRKNEVRIIVEGGLPERKS